MEQERSSSRSPGVAGRCTSHAPSCRPEPSSPLPLSVSLCRPPLLWRRKFRTSSLVNCFIPHKKGSLWSTRPDHRSERVVKVLPAVILWWAVRLQVWKDGRESHLKQITLATCGQAKVLYKISSKWNKTQCVPCYSEEDITEGEKDRPTKSEKLKEDRKYDPQHSQRNVRGIKSLRNTRVMREKTGKRATKNSVKPSIVRYTEVVTIRVKANICFICVHGPYRKQEEQIARIFPMEYIVANGAGFPSRSSTRLQQDVNGDPGSDSMERESLPKQTSHRQQEAYGHAAGTAN